MPGVPPRYNEANPSAAGESGARAAGERSRVVAGEVDREAVVAARALGLHRTQLDRLMEKYGISRPDES